MATLGQLCTGVFLVAIILQGTEPCLALKKGVKRQYSDSWEMYYPPKQLRQGEEANGVQITQTQLEESSRLECPPNLRLHILDASFGNASIRKGQIHKGKDDAPQSLPIVKNLCENKQECLVRCDCSTIKASFETFQTDDALSPEHTVLALRYTCIKTNSFFFPMKNLKAVPISDSSWNLKYNFGIHELYPFTVATENREALSKQYVTLKDFEADCLSNITSFGTLRSIEEAEDKCSNDSSCTFFIYKPMEAILCKSPSYQSPRKQTGSSIYVKASAFAVEDFHITPDSQGICDKNQRVGEAANVLSVDEAAEHCKANSDCKFFILSTVNGLAGAKRRFENYLWMCKGESVQVPHDGFIFGQKISSMFEHAEMEHRPRPYNNLVTSPGLRGHNGPLNIG